MVVKRISLGVNQLGACAAIHARAPVAPAPAAIAPIMHCTHTPRRVPEMAAAVQAVRRVLGPLSDGRGLS